MSHPQPACSQCSAPLPEALLRAGQPVACPSCQAPLEVLVFPALLRPPAGRVVPERIVMEGEAGCFYHPEKRAVIPCHACGRFLCSLCDTEFNQEHFCPNCLQTRRQKNQMPELVTNRILYDGAALVLTVGSTVLFCLWFFWIISAPMAIFLAVLSWTQPGSILPRSRFRAILAIILALLQLIGLYLLIRVFYFNDSPLWGR